jgi:hypothetical protein
MQKMEGNPRAGGGEGVSKSDRAAIHICTLGIEAELVFDRKILGGKGFIDLHQIHLTKGESSPLERLAGCRCRSDSHDLRLYANECP